MRLAYNAFSILCPVSSDLEKEPSVLQTNSIAVFIYVAILSWVNY